MSAQVSDAVPRPAASLPRKPPVGSAGVIVMDAAAWRVAPRRSVSGSSSRGSSAVATAARKRAKASAAARSAIPGGQTASQ